MVRPPLWQLPPGVSPGTWDYTHNQSIADTYETFLAGTPLVQADLRWVQDALPPPRQGEPTLVADLGCGNGRSAIPLAAQGYRVWGLDLSQPMLQSMLAAAAQQQVEVWPLRVNLVQLDGIGDQVVDHAVCLFSTLGMIRGRKHRRRFLAQVHRIVRPGGVLIVHAHNRLSWLRHPGGLRRTLASAWKALTSDDDFGDHVYAYRNLADMYLHSFSARELAADLRAAGWQIGRWKRVSLTGDRLLKSHEVTIAGGFFVVCQRSA